MAQLAKVLPVDESASTAKSAESLAAKEAGDSKSDLAASNALTNKGQATQVATQGPRSRPSMRGSSSLRRVLQPLQQLRMEVG